MNWKTLLLIGGLLPFEGALAQSADPLQFFVDESVRHDDNIFRLAPGEVVPRSPHRGDTRMRTTAGLRFDVPLSRQRIEGRASLFREDYARFDALDFTGHDLNATWHWQAGDALVGKLGAAHARQLSSFNNYAGTRADPLTLRRTEAELEYAMTPDWRLLAKLADQAFRHELRQQENVDLQAVEAGVAHVSRADNRIGLHLRQETGDYPNAPATGFSQRSSGLDVAWALSEKSQLEGRADYLQRDYDTANAPDFSGLAYRLGYRWRATEKLTLEVGLWREFAPVEDADTSQILLEGLGLRPRYAVTEKLTLTVSADTSRHDYVGSNTGRADRVRQFAATLAYEPTDALTLTGFMQREQRTSNTAQAEYTSHLMGLSLRLAF